MENVEHKLLGKNPEVADFRSEPIPTDLPSVSGWKELPIVESGEKLVPLGLFSNNDSVFSDSIYFGEREDSPYKNSPLQGSLATTFVRLSVAEKLKEAERKLPAGLHLVVFDAYRTLEVQASLYVEYHDALAVLNPDWSDEQLTVETQKYVSLPSHDPSRPSPHNTGGAVDLALFKLPEEAEHEHSEIRQALSGATKWPEIYSLTMKMDALIRGNGQVLNFGTSFDHGGIEASLAYYEKEEQTRSLNDSEKQAQANRRFLYHTMRSVGLEAYEDEWWHYNSPKSQMGAKAAGLSRAVFGPASLSEQDKEIENMRVEHRKGIINIVNGATLTGKVSILGEEYAIVKQASDRDGDPRSIKFPDAAIIKPNKV